MSNKKKPPKLAVLQGGKPPPSVHSVDGILQAVIEKHKTRRYTEIYIVAVRPSASHVMDVDIIHHSKDRVRLFGVINWALDRFRALYLPPVNP